MERIEVIDVEPPVTKRKWVYQTHKIKLPDGWAIATDWTANGFRPSVYGWSEVTIKLRRLRHETP